MVKTRSGKRTNRIVPGYRTRASLFDVGLAGAGAYLDYRTRAANRMANSRTMTMTQNRRNVRSGNGITTQHDRRLIYRKTRMPKYRKRRWKRFKNKVNAVSEKDLGTRSVLFNGSFSPSNNNASPSNNQFAYTIGLYGNQSILPSLNDLQYISQLENPGNPLAADGPSVYPSTKFIFKSAVLDLTIRNSSPSVTSLGPPVVVSLNPQAKVELDIYEITANKQFYENLQNSSNVSSYGNLEDLFTAMYAEEGLIADQNIAGEIKISPNSRGFTPFDATYAISRYGIKIWKKTKFFIPAGDTITYQIRDPKRHVITRRGLSSVSGANRPGLTRFLFLCGKLVPGVPQGNPVVIGNTALTLDIGISRKYVYKIEGVTDDRSEYIAQ